MQTDAVAADAAEYRPDRASLMIGVVGAVVWGLAVIAVGAACLLLNDRFRREWLAPILLLAFCAVMFLASAWLILQYFTHRLRITSQMVRSIGCLSTREIALARVHRVVWKPHFPSVLLDDGASRVRIGLGEYERREQMELIHRIREAFAGVEQEGWEPFERRFVPPRRDWTEVNARFGPDGVEYRNRKECGWWGAVGSVLFGLATIGSVSVALLNLDGSFGGPIGGRIIMAAIFGVSYGSFFAVFCWFTVRSVRHRLRITPKLVRSTGAFRVREILFANVDRVVWKPMRRGAVVLHGNSHRVRISFDDYARNEAVEIVHRIRSGVAGRPEEGWDRFEFHGLFVVGGEEMSPAQARRLLRFVLIACGASTAIATAALLWAKSVDEFSRMSWTAAALLPVTVFAILVGFVWLMVRPALVRPDQSPKPV